MQVGGAPRAVRSQWVISGALLIATVLLTSFADARRRGLSGGGCEGCHDNRDNSELGFQPLEAEPGQTISIEFLVHDADAQVAGIFVETEDLAGLSIPAGEPLAVVSGGVTHTLPKDLENGKATFAMNYRVPALQGSTRFSVWTVAGNGDGRNGGDEGNHEVFDLVYGCEPQVYYRDLDGDGHGRDTSPRTHCAGGAPEGYAAFADDCDDNSAERHPGATEFCNRKDDNCDGVIDENALPVQLFPDSDGDGYYSFDEGQSEDTVMGCVPYPGYADQAGDCNPDSPEVNPGAEEICDQILDEDCDGRVDERVRPICGEGWCRRESLTCSLDDCVPGDPVEESCNFLDDDCDGEVDEGALCPSGQACLAGACRDSELESSPLGEPPSPDGGSGVSPSKSSPSSRGCHFHPSPRGHLPLLTLLIGGLTLGRRRRRGVVFSKESSPGPLGPGA